MRGSAADLPDWPALMDLQTACAYVSLSESSFRFLAARRGVRAVDLGLACARYRRKDLDAMLDSLPARGAEMAPGALAAPADDFELALRKAGARRRG